MHDFQYGAYFQESLLLSCTNTTTIGLHYNEIETTNPLGSHTSVHKMGFFYYIVKNLPPVYNCQLRNCLLLPHSEERKTYGLKKILSPLSEFFFFVEFMYQNIQ